jgi:catabolite regulation protein CreA
MLLRVVPDYDDRKLEAKTCYLTEEQPNRCEGNSECLRDKSDKSLSGNLHCV